MGSLDCTWFREEGVAANPHGREENAAEEEEAKGSEERERERKETQSFFEEGKKDGGQGHREDVAWLSCDGDHDEHNEGGERVVTGVEEVEVLWVQEACEGGADPCE